MYRGLKGHRDLNNKAIPVNARIGKLSTKNEGGAQKEYPPFLVFLFLVMAAYLVLPLIDVPFLGLSLSAPIFALIALQALFAPPRPWLHEYRGWILLALLIWLGVFISAVGNGLLSGGINIDRDGVLTVIRYAYWLLVFVMTAYFASQENIAERVAGVLGWAVFGLALFRLFEALAWGKIGAWTGTRFLSQNNYGFLFSTFFPYLLAPMISTRGLRRWGMVLRMLAVGAAVIINGSRGSWIGVAAGVLLFALIQTLSNPRQIGVSLLVVLISALSLAVLNFAPYQVTAAFNERFATLQQLDEDKSYAIRLLMNQKGLRLFEESPLIGVGPSRFTKSSTELDIPVLLQYASQYHFDSKSAHNSYIAFLAETGLVGSVPFVCLLITLAIKGLKSSIQLARQQQFWASGVYVSFLAMSIHMWAINSLTNTANWFVYGLVAALIHLASCQVENSSKKI